MSDDIIIGVDLAKNVFQLHGARRDGHLLFRKKLSRSQFAKFCKEHPRCLIAMEACATAHYWARELEKLGHVVRLIPPKALPSCLCLREAVEVRHADPVFHAAPEGLSFST